MNRRRNFLKIGMGSFAGICISLSPLFSLIQRAYAQKKKTILPKGIKEKSLIHSNPGSLDTSNLETTLLENFGTMGTSDYVVNLNDNAMKPC